MINSNEKTRLSAARRVSRGVSRVGKWALRLTCLFALLLALSPSSKAMDMYIYGDFSDIGLTLAGNDWVYNNREKMTEVSGSNNYQFKYEFTPSKNGTIFFRFFTDSTEKCPSSKSNTEVPDTYNSEYSASINGGDGAFTLYCTTGKKYTIEIHKEYGYSNFTCPRVMYYTENISTTTAKYYLKGDFNSWSGNIEFTGSGNTYTAKVAKWKNSDGENDNDGFLIEYNSGNYTNGGNEIGNNSTVNIEYQQYPAHMKLANSAEGKEVTFTLTLSNGTPSKLKAVWTESSSGNTQTGDYVIYFDNSVAKWNPPYVYVWAGSSNNGWPGVKMTHVSGDIWSYEYDPKYTDVLFNNGTDPDSNKTGNFKLINKHIYNKNSDLGYYGIPVYPIGIYNEDDLKKYNDETYYLIGEVLNANRVTPEYQFVKQTSGKYAGKYTLDLTLRNTHLRWSNSDDQWGDYPMKVVGFKTKDSLQAEYAEWNKWEELKYGSSTNDLSGTNGEYLGGIKATAIYDPTATVKLSFEYDKTNGKLPFISLVGANWKQKTPAAVPGYGGKSKTTNDGWQDSWIQYTNKGTVARDRNGNVMYNTMWPPRNPITFKTEFSLSGTTYDFTVKSTELVLSPSRDNLTGEETYKGKSGEEWKKDPRMNFVVKGDVDSNTDNLSNGNFDWTSNDYADKLALDDNKVYKLYVVENVWINGAIKFWTGWNGGTANNGGGNWNNHANWGHYKQQVSSDANKVINANATVPLGNVDGDMAFNEPTFFKALYFFYDTEGGNTTKRNIFIAELAEGGAEIAALNSSNYDYGYYRPALTDIQRMSNHKVKAVKIDCFKADGSEEFMGNVLTLDNISGKSVADFYTLFDNDNSTSIGSVDNKGVSKAKWIKYADSENFANGDYRFVMTVTLEDGSGIEKDPIVVESNPFTIYNSTIKMSMNAYQLVQVGDDDKHYVTFKGDNGKPTTPVYDIRIDDNGKITYTKGTIVPKYEDQTQYTFTNKVLLAGLGHDYADEVLNYRFKAASNTVDGTTYTDEDVQPQYDDRFIKIVDQDALASTSYALQMQYKMNFDADGKATTSNFDSTVGTTNFALTVPTPKLEKAKIDVYYGTANGEGEDNDRNATESFVFTVGEGENARTFNLENARYHNLRELVQVSVPNATSELAEKMGEMYEVTMDGSKLDLTDGVWTSKIARPSEFFKPNDYSAKVIDLTVKANTTVPRYNRWEKGEITYIAIDAKAPLTEQQKSDTANAKVKITDNSYRLYYDNEGKGNLKEEFDLNVMVNAKQTNFISHEEKDLGNDNLLHGDTTTGRYDYFYVAVVNKTTNEVVALNNGDDTKLAEAVLKVEELDSKGYSSEGIDAGGYVFNFDINHGHWYEEQVEAIQANPYYKNLEVRVSYLYPFFEEEQVSERKGYFRSAANLTGTVLKSEATVWDVKGPEVWTGVEGIDSELRASVKAGVGFVAVEGQGVEVYNAQGMMVAAGEGRHELPAGVYVVRVNGQTHKVIVR